jgi:crossover junction endodeoxyribonuclease RusA
VKVCLTLPYPPSGNRVTRRGARHQYESPESKAYKTNVGLLLKSQRVTKFDKEALLSVTAHIYRASAAGDLDNRLKALLDALNGVLWADDRQIVEIHAYRHDDKANPRVELLVTSNNCVTVGTHEPREISETKGRRKRGGNTTAD